MIPAIADPAKNTKNAAGLDDIFILFIIRGAAGFILSAN
jgi:hypothetical protein